MRLFLARYAANASLVGAKTVVTIVELLSFSVRLAALTAARSVVRVGVAATTEAMEESAVFLRGVGKEKGGDKEGG